MIIPLSTNVQQGAQGVQFDPLFDNLAIEIKLSTEKRILKICQKLIKLEQGYRYARFSRVRKGGCKENGTLEAHYY